MQRLISQIGRSQRLSVINALKHSPELTVQELADRMNMSYMGVKQHCLDLAKDGYLDKQAGMKLRHEIYEPGDSRDVNVSIEKFLGRKQSVQPFLKKIGIGAQAKNQASVESSQKSK